MSAPHSHFANRLKISDMPAVCKVSPKCGVSATHVIGWKQFNNIKGEPREVVIKKPACEKCARMFAFKKGLKIA